MRQTDFKYSGELDDFYIFESMNRNCLIEIYKNNEKNILFEGNLDHNKLLYYFEVTLNGTIIINKRSEVNEKCMNYTSSYSSIRDKLPIPKYVHNALLYLHYAILDDIDYFKKLTSSLVLPIRDWVKSQEIIQENKELDYRNLLLSIMIKNDLKNT